VMIGEPPGDGIRGYLMHKSGGRWVVCQPECSWKDGEPFFASYRPDQMERVDGAPVLDEIIHETDDGLFPGAPVLATNERGETHRCAFTAEFRGWRMFTYPVGSDHALPRAQVVPVEPRITEARVRALSEEIGVSLHQARRVLFGRNLRQKLKTADSIEDVRPILLQLINEAYPDVKR